MQLVELISGLKCEVIGKSNIDIVALACDTSKVKKGCMFFCIKGGQADGHDFAPKVVLDGAVVLVVTHILEVNCTQLVVDDVRLFMALLAKRFSNNAIDKMKLICVIGTNGKTSTTYLLNGIFEQAGYNTAVIGTNGIFINKVKYASTLTTPDPIELHSWFTLMYKEKVHFVIMEVSAHAIFYNKIAGLVADVAVFTNLSQDHLDFFPSMQVYADTKKSFFDKKFAKVAVVNADDELGKQIIFEQKIPIVSYGLENPSDVFAIDCVANENGISYVMNLYDDVKEVSYSLHGKFNIYNTLCASTVARVFGIKLDVITQGIMNVKRIDGRNESFFRRDGLRVVIDFAHTPDGVENILKYLSDTTKGLLIVVFGCGGNRDRFKRPLMGKIVGKYSDFAIITNDNPRFESPIDIVKDIECGMLNARYDVELNRSKAIIKALKMATSEDTVAILGKGAEEYQEINGKKYSFSDYEVVKSLL